MPSSASLGLFLSCTNAISQRNSGPYNPIARFFGSFKTPRPSGNSGPGDVCVFYLFGGNTISLNETPATSGVKRLFRNPMGLRSVSDTTENKARGFRLPMAEWTQTVEQADVQEGLPSTQTLASEASVGGADSCG